MIITSDIPILRNHISAWRKAGERIAFVPTMGNLHAGHLTLVEQARGLADRIVVSIFVNPLQFGPGEDFDQYPRTEKEDIRKLEIINNDLLFKPNVKDIIGISNDTTTQVYTPYLSDILCGASRPGHFTGVTTIVAKLFNLVQPDSAIFGQKDYQQALIIQKMAYDLHFPINILIAPTCREEDGLAMSSRNQYLTPEQRKIAPLLQQTLQEMKSNISKKQFNYKELEGKYKEILEENGFKVAYLVIRTQETLDSPSSSSEKWVILAAAFLGNTRLIDNLLC